MAGPTTRLLRNTMREINLTKGTHMSNTNLIPSERIEKTIYVIRGERVMLDRDLAELYEVETKALNQAVRRNPDRFPADFMFQLSEKEVGELNRSQFVTGSEKHRDPRFRPYAFTEQGVAMLSSVLRSKRAITVNIEIMRAFVKLRQMLASNSELSHRLDELESKYDKQFKVVFDAIRRLMATPVRNRKEIGFRLRSVKK
jgi:ORF6N domain-containing protein